MKCQAEQLANTNQVGRDFRQQPDTFDNPATAEKDLTPAKITLEDKDKG